MLSKKDAINNTPLSAVKKTSARVIPLKKEEEEKKDIPSRDKLLPPLSQFNTGYIKARDNDPL